ncbi:MULTISPECIES: ABC transporter substrate-binding protein [Streptomyces]|uniref:ABC transporter substrate-binding protein n=1 Tax=Streptomyces lycii TaxID=2654337 RepID=A0ABQ7FC56_9ACTN|nr:MULTISPECIES: ABC transporter substrate-binding protein [Streptomyces]KAF4406210.1 ABC transporter substrate-binding protein [Streptomyces lycii]PGH47117.1 ABC transporter [Streptomyces sp. Ru87]
MNRNLARRGRAAAVALAAGALVLTACSDGGGGGGGGEKGGTEEAEQQGLVQFAGAEESQGPAEDVEGAKPGGTIRVFQRDSYAHLDPAQIYVSDEGSLASLIHRRLTTVKMDNDGEYSVVGDLATDSGERSDDGRTWTYTLKDGIKFEDGSPITSKDIRHTFERQFADFITEGPSYVQSWLAGKTEYRDLLPGGPYKGDHLPDSVLETPDDKTVVFHFKKPQNDLPYALGMPGYGVVPAGSKDTRQKYDKDPLATGPYKIESFKSGKSMTLVRNTEWDPETDPARHQYPDKFEITFNHQNDDSSKRLLSDTGENQFATSFNNAVDAGTIPQVMGDAEAEKRTISGYQTYVAAFAINMDRIKDHDVRLAIAHALPIKSILAPYGGAAGGELAGGLISPLLPGYEKGYDPFGKLKKPGGDPEKAKQLLEKAGKVGMKLSFPFRNATEEQQGSVAIADALEKAGFDVQRKELPADTYYDLIGKVDNKYDLYRSNWGHDWVSSSTVIPPQFDGRRIEDGGNNYSHVKDDRINSEIDRISAIADPEKAAPEWFELNKYIVEEVTPMVPAYYYKHMQISGSKIGGMVYNNDLSGIDPTKLYVKQ